MKWLRGRQGEGRKWGIKEGGEREVGEMKRKSRWYKWKRWGRGKDEGKDAGEQGCGGESEGWRKVMGGRRRRGRSGGEAGAQSVCSQEESAAAAGQWTVSTTDPNGRRAVSRTLE